MLQRAASNAYSWWWASHIRTDQSKWLDNNLQEMEDRVKSMLKIIEEDADSFAKRAEMYYKRRPELLSFVEETYKAYRALAERYDRISGELHKANHTLATAFPDVQFSMPDDEDDDNFPSESNTSTDSIDQAHRLPPEVPPINMINKKSETKLPSKKPGPMRAISKASEAEAKELIDRLQKGILVLQTEKEFIKSSYESGIAKYWEIEKQITEMQEEVCSLQDEFSASTVIEDDEARALMAVTALRSCQDTIVNLQEQQKRSIEETRVESARIKIAKEKFKALKGENGELEKEIVDCSEVRRTEVELKTICDKVKDHLAISAETSVVELAEKIDELVNKVIGLELTVSSQTAQITNLRSETDCLQKHLRGFEEEKMSPIDDPADHLRDRMNQVEDDLEKLASPSQDDDISFLDEESQIDHVEREIIKTEAINEGTSGFHELGPILKEHKEDHIESNLSAAHLESSPGKPLTPQTSNPDDDSDQQGDQDDAPNLKQLLLNGLEGREKVFLGEYMSILRNYKDTKNKLLEVEKKNQEYFSETMSQVRELKSENAVKDDEIRSLRQILISIQTSSNSNRAFSESPKPQAPDELKQYGVVDEETTVPTSIASPIEEKFRKEIDTLLDENLEFWLRFSTSFHQIQRFRNDFQSLQEDRERGVNVAEKPDKLPFEKQLRELKTELQVWVEQNSLLRGELKSRFSSLCSIQEDISEALKASLVDDNVRFTPYQAAKFQGEVLNMKQENNKVADELQAGMDHVTGLQTEVESALSKLQERFEPRSGSGAQGGHNRNFLHFSSKSRGVPLRSFLYGVKPKKPSIFSCMNPALQKQYSDLRAGHPT